MSLRLGSFPLWRTRRRLLATLAGGTVASAVGVFGYTLGIGPHHLAIRSRDVFLPRLPAAWEGRKLVHIADLHVGPRVDPAYLRRSLAEVNALRPDLVAITGDFVDSGGHEQLGGMRDLLSELEIPAGGVHATLGNHDYGHGWRDQAAADELAGELHDLGIAVLRNERRSVDGLEVVGCDDLWAGRFEPGEALAGIDPGAAHLALSHNPDSVDEEGWDGFHGLVLAGHTHGGQCKPPFLPPPMLPVNNRRYTRGLFELDNGSTLHITAGVGHLLKARFNCRPEINVLTLRKAEA